MSTEITNYPRSRLFRAYEAAERERRESQTFPRSRLFKSEIAPEIKKKSITVAELFEMAKLAKQSEHVARYCDHCEGPCKGKMVSGRFVHPRMKSRPFSLQEQQEQQAQQEQKKIQEHVDTRNKVEWNVLDEEEMNFTIPLTF